VEIKKILLSEGEKFSFETHINEFLLPRESAELSEVFSVVIPVGFATHGHEHDDREQIFYVLSGNGSIFTDANNAKNVINMEKGSIFWIPKYAYHKISNTNRNCDLKYICINAFVNSSQNKKTSYDHAINVINSYNLEKKQLNERPVLVVGSEGFVGKAVVKKLIAKGRYVWALDLEKKNVVSQNGERIEYIEAGADGDFYALLKELCINNGVCPEKMICAIGDNSVRKHSLNFDRDEFVSQLMKNITPVFDSINSYAKICVENSINGGITVLGSVGAQKSHRETIGYDVAKGGLESMCRCLALDYAPYNININCLAIGPIEGSSSSMDDGIMTDSLRKLIPIGYYPSVEDIAEYIVEFTFSAPLFLTGQTLVVDGGLTIQLRPIEIERLNDRDMYNVDKI